MPVNVCGSLVIEAKVLMIPLADALWVSVDPVAARKLAKVCGCMDFRGAAAERE